MSKKIKVIHIGKRATQLTILSDKFQYIWLPLAYDFTIDEKSLLLFIQGKFNPQNHDAIFIIEKYAKIIDKDITLLKQLPAHRILYPKEAKYQREVEDILLLKGAIALDFTEVSEIETFINENYSSKQEGYKLNSDYVAILKNFKGSVIRKGNSYIELSGPFPDKMQQIMTWKMTTNIGKEDRFEFFPEFDIVQGTIELAFKVYLIKENTGELTKSFDIPINKIPQGEKIIIENVKESAYMNISLFAKGKNAKIRIGAIHLRKALRNNYTLLPGGKTIHDPEMLNGEVIHYFEPGDFKPPLAVYFSGYRSAEGFEGRRMMSSMGCPFLLIGDPRLEGGCFYMGSPLFEQEIVKIIQEKLSLLGFKSSDLILSGLSMGTFGALYYASDLHPNSVIVGKPLTNVGDIAVNGRIKRPNEFSTALDILFTMTHHVSQKSAKVLNEKFWRKFRKGNYANTRFAIAYMKDDDYDKFAFPKLFKTIKKNYPDTKILYKGLVGRHNDNSPEINNWFLKQYRNVMVQTFQRTPSKFK